MSEADKRVHEQWLGMVQPSEGLVGSLPVLVEAQFLIELSFLNGRRNLGSTPIRTLLNFD